MKTEMKNFYDKNATSVKTGIVLLLICIIAVALHVFAWPDVPLQILAACVGAGLTVVITSILLQQQSKDQNVLLNKQEVENQKLREQQKKDQMEFMQMSKDKELDQIIKTEQYKKKMEVYENYLNFLLKIFSDKKITEEEKIELQFQTSILAMHASAEHIQKVSECIGEVIKAFKQDKDEKQEATMYSDLQSNLFKIMLQFREELYINEKEWQNPDSLVDEYQYIVNKFSKAFDIDAEKEDDNKEFILAEDGKTNGNETWEEAKTKWTKDNKRVIIDEDDAFVLHRTGNRDIHVQMGFWQGHYYIQAKYHRFPDFAKELKWKYKGRRQYEAWWKNLNELGFEDYKEGTLKEELKSSVELQRKLIQWVDELWGFIEKWDVVANRYYELMKNIDKDHYEQKGWGFWIFNSDTVVCDSHKSNWGDPFIDTFPEDDKIVIRFGNRRMDRQMQEKILDGLKGQGLYRGPEFSELIVEELDGPRTNFAKFNIGTSNEIIMERVKELMEAIEKL